MNNTITSEEIVSGLSKNKGLKDICTSLSTIWAELDSDSERVEAKKQKIQELLVSLVQKELVKIELEEQWKLRKHRVLLVRAEINVFWSKCHFSVEQQEEFQPYRSDDFTDELLIIHKTELQRLKEYFSDNEKLFEVVEEYLKLYEHSVFLEVQNKNPNRLFENRGAQLLKDERDRKAAKKDLPKYEKKIATMTTNFATKYGRKFTINGKTFEETLNARTEKITENTEGIKMQNDEEMKIRVAHGSTLKRKIPESKSSVKSTVKQPRLTAGPNTFRRAL